MNKKNIFLWTLYDFANSIAIVVFTVYFSAWVVVDRGVSDLWFNLTFAATTLLLIITAPILGIVADKSGNRMRYLRILTGLFFLSLVGVSLLAISAPTKMLLILGLFTLANYFYLFSFSFYNPMIQDLAPLDKQGMVSGLGQMANWLGSIAGLLITLPLVTGAVVLIANAPARVQTFLPATILFLILALPMLILYKDRPTIVDNSITVKTEYVNYWKELRELLRRPGMGRFLLGYFLFNDAVLTGSNNFAIYLDQVFHVSDATKSYVLFGILVVSAIGAFVTGWISDRIGLKKTLIIVLVCWAVTFPVLGLLQNFMWFAIATGAMGFLFGAIWTVSRAVMSYLSPVDKINHAFSYFTMFERFSSLVGPVAWGIIVSVIFNSGAARYRIALISMSVFIILGLWAVLKIPSDKKA